MATTNWSADNLYTLSIAEIFILPHCFKNGQWLAASNVRSFNLRWRPQKNMTCVMILLQDMNGWGSKRNILIRVIHYRNQKSQVKVKTQSGQPKHKTRINSKGQAKTGKITMKPGKKQNTGETRYEGSELQWLQTYKT